MASLGPTSPTVRFSGVSLAFLTLAILEPGGAPIPIVSVLIHPGRRRRVLVWVLVPGWWRTCRAESASTGFHAHTHPGDAGPFVNTSHVPSPRGGSVTGTLFGNVRTPLPALCLTVRFADRRRVFLRRGFGSRAACWRPRLALSSVFSDSHVSDVGRGCKLLRERSGRRRRASGATPAADATSDPQHPALPLWQPFRQQLWQYRLSHTSRPSSPSPLLSHLSLPPHPPSLPSLHPLDTDPPAPRPRWCLQECGTSEGVWEIFLYSGETAAPQGKAGFLAPKQC